MIRITVGLGENKNIIKACSILDKRSDLNINIVKDDEELISAIYDEDIDGVVRGSLSASGVIKSLKNKSPKKINRGTFIHSKEYEFLILPVGIDEGRTIEDKVILAKQASEFILKLNLSPRIAILSGGRSDDSGRTKEIDNMLNESSKLFNILSDEFNDDENFKNVDYSIKNYNILIEQAINDKNNIIIAPNGIIGNYIFRILVLLCKWPSYGGVTLGIDSIYIDTSRDQTVEGYVRSIELAYRLASLKNNV
ncbi:MAG: methanogenesis marker protein Mmp4/MtxX [Methanobrevibacter sp.]